MDDDSADVAELPASHQRDDSQCGRCMAPLMGATFCPSCRLFFADRSLRAERPTLTRRFLVDVVLESLLIIVTLGIGWLVWFVFTAENGQTPAKSITGMYIAKKRTGSLASEDDVWSRELVIKGFAQGFLTLGVGIWVSYARALWDENRETLHDKWSGTVVLYSPAGAPDIPPPPKQETWGLADIARAIALVIIGTVISLLPLALLVYFIVDGGKAEDDPTALTVTIGSSAVLQFLMVYGVHRFSIRKYGLSWSAVGLRWPRKAAFWLPIPLVIGAYAIIAAYFALLSAAGIHPNTDLPEGVYDNVGPVVAVAVLSLVFAPVMEEIFFRGFVFGGLRRRWGVLWAALGSGLLFGIVHALNPGAFYIVPPIALVGALFALGYAYSGSIMGTMMAHFLFNLLSLLSGLLSS